MPRKKEPEPEPVQLIEPGEPAPTDPLIAQYNLPLSEQKKLIVMTGLRPDDETVRMAVSIARAAQVPLFGINLINTRQGIKPYINSEGVAWRLAHDEREVVSESSATTHYPSKEEPYAEVTCTIELGNGQTFRRKGAVTIDNQWNEGNAILKAETKGFRRAGYAAIRRYVSLPQYDEDAKLDNGTVEGAWRVVGEPRTVLQLLSYLDREKIGDAEFKALTGLEVGQVEERDLKAIFLKLEARKNTE